MGIGVSPLLLYCFEWIFNVSVYVLRKHCLEHLKEAAVNQRVPFVKAVRLNLCLLFTKGKLNPLLLFLLKLDYFSGRI